MMRVTAGTDAQWMEFGGACIRVSLKRGSSDQDTPVLFLHGFGGAMGVWYSLLNGGLTKRDLMLLDLLGHGDSDKPANGYQVTSQAGVAFATLDHFGCERCHVVAHSAGGDVAVAMAEMHPDRIASICLFGTAPNLSFVHMDPVAKLLRAPLIGRLLWNSASESAIRKGLLKTFAPGWRDVPDIYVSSLRRMTHQAYVKGIDELERYKSQRDLRLRVDNGAFPPILVVFGTLDQWVHPSAADHWAGATSVQVKMLAGVGHTPMAEAPREMSALILEHIDRVGA